MSIVKDKIDLLRAAVNPWAVAGETGTVLAVQAGDYHNLLDVAEEADILVEKLGGEGLALAEALIKLAEGRR